MEFDLAFLDRVCRSDADVFELRWYLKTDPGIWALTLDSARLVHFDKLIGLQGNFICDSRIAPTSACGYYVQDFNELLYLFTSKRNWKNCVVPGWMYLKWRGWLPRWRSI